MVIEHAEQTTLMQQENTICLEANIWRWKQLKHKLCQFYVINAIWMGPKDFASCNIINSTSGTHLNPAQCDV
jgi:hypothetical protein